MGKSNWIIAGLGLLAIVALSLIMKQALNVHRSRSSSPVTVAVNKEVGARLDAPPAFRIEKLGERRRGVLRLRPTLETHVQRLVRDAGERAWLTAGKDEFDELVVVCDAGVGDIERFEVSPPWKLGPSVVRLQDEPAAPGGGR